VAPATGGQVRVVARIIGAQEEWDATPIIWLNGGSRVAVDRITFTLPKDSFSVEVYDVASGKRIAAYGHSENIALSPDGTRLLRRSAAATYLARGDSSGVITDDGQVIPGDATAWLTRRSVVSCQVSPPALRITDIVHGDTRTVPVVQGGKAAVDMAFPIDDYQVQVVTVPQNAGHPTRPRRLKSRLWSTERTGSIHEKGGVFRPLSGVRGTPTGAVPHRPDCFYWLADQSTSGQRPDYCAFKVNTDTGESELFLSDIQFMVFDSAG